DPGKEVGHEVALDDAAIDDAVLVETFRQVGRDPRGDKLLEAVGIRLLQRAFDIIRANFDLGDPVLVEQRLKPAVGDGGALGGGEIEALDPQHAEDRDDHVPEVDVDLLVHRSPTSAVCRRYPNIANC